MHFPKASPRALAACAVTVVAASAAVAATGAADPSHGFSVGDVPSANEKAPGYAPASRLSAGLAQVAWAQGATLLENPDGIVTTYGYESDTTTSSGGGNTFPQMVPPTTANPTEAQKTEPDKNTYLTLRDGASGPDATYPYGRHFLYQGHEVGATVNGQKQSYITRVNLDADAQHRVTLMATRDAAGKPIAPIDGSTWDPFAQRLIFTTESSSAPTYAATLDYPSKVSDVSGALGRGGYEGVQNDSDGNLWIVEDIGGATKPGTTASKQPNSFVYRYVPRHPGDLGNGKLQVLQVLDKAGSPITFGSQATFPSADQQELHSYGNSLATKWVTIHDTATDGTAPFQANALAKAAQGTPFKRPENGVFRPGSRFREFYFDETGDTNATSTENAYPNGGWGGIQRLVQSSPSADEGRLSLLYSGDQAHTGLDNVAFLTRDLVTFVEDAGDGLHSQRNALDSGFVFDVNKDYRSAQPTRWLAEGRDPSATLDSGNAGYGKNEGDNEITGVHVSDGDPSTGGILGAKIPTPFAGGWRWFYTQQHGDNVTYEVIPAPTAGPGQHGQGDGPDRR